MHITILGAGIIGLACGWHLVQRGAKVTLVDKTAPGRGASWAAAGMLAPAYEAAGEPNAHPALFDLCKASAELWPSFASSLAQASGMDIGYHVGPTLAVARNRSESMRLDKLAAAMDRRGLAYRRLPSSDARQVEPSLTNELLDCLLLPSDGWVDNRRACKALVNALEAAGARFCIGPASLEKESIQSDVVLETLGAKSRLQAIVPVKGMAFSLRPEDGLPRHTLRFGDGYIVPHGNRLIVGATVEWGRDDLNLDAKAISEMRRQSASVCPQIANAETLERWAGVRPGTLDHAPIIGKIGPQRWGAMGHYRNGVLLAPITAQIIASQILDGHSDELAHNFAPTRLVADTG